MPDRSVVGDGGTDDSCTVIELRRRLCHEATKNRLGNVRCACFVLSRVTSLQGCREYAQDGDKPDGDYAQCNHNFSKTEAAFSPWWPRYNRTLHGVAVGDGAGSARPVNCETMRYSAA